jgi:beta-phosphoglucomutase-like phosphatase (HAD superfamily)
MVGGAVSETRLRFRKHVPQNRGFWKEVSITEQLHAADENTEAMAFCFDFDGVLSLTNRFQRLAWEEAVYETFPVKGSLACRRQIERAVIRAIAQIRICAQTGNWYGFREGLWRSLSPIVPKGMSSPEQLDAFLSAIRDRKIYHFAERGEIPMADGMEPLLEDAHSRGVKCGVNTSNGSVQVEALLCRFLGQRKFDRLIPPQHRLYGRDSAGKRLKDGTAVDGKPYSHGYRWVAEQMGVPFGRMVVIEDHLPTIAQAVADGALGGVWIPEAGPNGPESADALWRQVEDSVGESLACAVILAPTSAVLRV